MADAPGEAETKQIMVALTAGDSPALGNVWRITAKKTDFYLDPLSAVEAFHLSIHGPNDQFDRHRFHVKVDRRVVTTAKKRGYVMAHSVGKDSFAFDGQQVAEGAYRVARIRWTWHLQRSRFRAAAVSGQAPELAEHQSGVRRSELLSPNDAWDIDVVVSYERPYWPEPSGSLRDNARLEALRNNADLWLTATSYHRSQAKYPVPEGLFPPLPRAGEVPNRILCAGPGPEGADDMYWFVETITSRDVIERLQAP